MATIQMITRPNGKRLPVYYETEEDRIESAA